MSNHGQTEPYDNRQQEQDEQELWESLSPLEQFEIMLKDPKFKAEYEREIAKLAQGGI